LYPVPPRVVAPLLAAGAALGVLADVLFHSSGPPPGLGLSLWVAAVAVALVLLHRRAALALDRERIVWLVIGVLLAAGLSWRDSTTLKPLALAAATFAFALVAHRRAAAWIRRAGVVRYAWAFALGALHGWTAAILAIADAVRTPSDADARRNGGWRNAAAVVRGLVIAAPLIALFGALFMNADAVFAKLVENLIRVDLEWIAGHIALFAVFAWLSTGYLRGALTGTEPPLADIWPEILEIDARKRRALGIIEVATALAAIDLLFLVFVVVQFRYLFGGATLVQVTPDLTYAEYARRGFFELVFAVVLVVPILLAADWLLDSPRAPSKARRTSRDASVFLALAATQIGLVLAIAASALERLRLYYASYGFTESRFYAMVLLLWIGAMLVWLASTVLRGRRDRFAFGMLASGLATLALLFIVNPDASIARTNVARLKSGTAVPFDVKYATSMSADAVPVLIDALPALPPDVQCPLARFMLRRWPPEKSLGFQKWSWSAARATSLVRDRQAQLRAMLGPDGGCAGTPNPEP
jgi:hypothetical protein